MAGDEEKGPFLSVAECAARKGVSYMTILRAVKSGKIDSHSVGKVHVIPEAACNSFEPETPKESGRRGGNTRWAGHEKPEPGLKRPRGRPRKSQPEQEGTG